jgi:hypothetical protein
VESTARGENQVNGAAHENGLPRYGANAQRGQAGARRNVSSGHIGRFRCWVDEESGKKEKACRVGRNATSFSHVQPRLVVKQHSHGLALIDGEKSLPAGGTYFPGKLLVL